MNSSRKSILICLILLTITSLTYAQVGVGTTSPNASAQLDVSSTTKGFLPPRMTYAQRQLISGPVAGLIIWCSNCGEYGEIQVYNGKTWTNMIGGAAIPEIAIGSNYGGGKVFYLFNSGESGYVAGEKHGLIASGSDISGSNAPWYNGEFTLTNATGTAVGTGSTNTNLIITSQGNTGSYAAKLCADYSVTVGGVTYDDWYMPSRNEMNLMYTKIGQGALSPNTNIGGFQNFYYWTSSEFSPNLTWYRNFDGGGENVTPKDSQMLVRAVRYF